MTKHPRLNHSSKTHTPPRETHLTVCSHSRGNTSSDAGSRPVVSEGHWRTALVDVPCDRTAYVSRRRSWRRFIWSTHITCPRARSTRSYRLGPASRVLSTARAGNRCFAPSSALRAHTNKPAVHNRFTVEYAKGA